MTCAHVLDLIDAGPFAISPPAQLDAAREHAIHCPTCGPAFTMMRQLEADLAALGEPAPPPDLAAGVLSRIARIPDAPAVSTGREAAVREWRAWPAWAGAAGGAAAIAAIQWTAPGAFTAFMPRTGGVVASLIAVPPLEPAAAVLAVGLLFYAKGLFSMTATPSAARLGADADTGSAPR